MSLQLTLAILLRDEPIHPRGISNTRAMKKKYAMRRYVAFFLVTNYFFPAANSYLCKGNKISSVMRHLI